MALSFDDFPFYNQVIDPKTLLLTETWEAAFSTHIQTLFGYLNQYGMFVPRLTTDQRDQIQSPINGQLIYNTSTDEFQGYKAGAWSVL